MRSAIATTTITTATSDNLLVNGKDIGATISCGGGGSCAVTWALYVDGQAVPNSGEQLSANASGSMTKGVVVYGIMPGVAAGMHTVELAYVFSAQTTGIGFGCDPQVEAIALGG